MRTRPRTIDATCSSPGIDLAPMLDFVTNLLIFFIVTAVFVKESGLTVNRPTGISSDPLTSSKSILIGNDGVISMDAKPVDIRAVRAHIEQFRAVEPEGGVSIVAQAHAPTGTLVTVIDQVHLGGVFDITFSTAR